MDSVVRKALTTSVILLCILLPQWITAQPAIIQNNQISGEVTDRKTGEPISDAVISVSASENTITTKTDGTFKLVLQTAKNCTLTVTKNGYEKTIIPIDPDTVDSFYKIPLTQLDISELQKITVKADRKKQEVSKTISKQTISSELIAKLPNVGQADVFRTLQLLPGISGTNESSSGLYVRGGTPDQNLILLDGIPIYYVDHFYGFFSAFNPLAIEDVSIHKGGFGAEWGGRLSSVVNLKSNGINRKFDSDRIRFMLGSGLMSNEGILELPLKNNELGTIMISGRHSLSSMFETNLFRDISDQQAFDLSKVGTPTQNPYAPYSPYVAPYKYVLQALNIQPQFYFWDINALAAFNIGSNGRLSTTFFASQDFEDNAADTTITDFIVDKVRIGYDTTAKEYLYENDTTNYAATLYDQSPTNWGNLCIGQQWEQQWTQHLASTVNLSYSSFTDKKERTYYERYDEPDDPTASKFDSTWKASKNKVVDISAKMDNSLELSNWHKIKAGLELSRKSVSYRRDTLPPPDTATLAWWSDSSTPEYMEEYKDLYRAAFLPLESYDTGYSAAVYVSDEMSFNNRIGFSLGTRLYYFNLLSTFTVDPRVSAWFKPYPDLKVKGAWGIYTQEIHRAEDEDIMGGSNFVWLLANENRPLEKSYQYIGGVSWEKKHFLIDLEAYYKQLSGLLTVSEQLALSWIQENPFNPDDLPLYEGSGTAKGIELLAQVKNLTVPLFSKDLTYDGWVTYTWSSIINTYSVFNTGNPFPATQDRPHEVKIVNCLEWDHATWSSITLGLVWLYSTGRPYTAPLGSYTLRSIKNQDLPEHYYVSDKNKYRLPDYHRLDVSATWEARLWKRLKSKLTLGFFNVYNHDNIVERTFVKSGGPSSQTAYYTNIDKKTMPLIFNTALQLSTQF